MNKNEYRPVHRSVRSRKPFLLAASAMLAAAPFADAGIFRGDIDVQTYRDYAENRGVFQPGATNVTVYKSDGSVAGVIAVVPDFDSVNDGGYVTMINPSFGVSVDHVSYTTAPTFSKRFNDTGLAYSIFGDTYREVASIAPASGYDYKIMRYSKIVIDAAPTPLMTDTTKIAAMTGSQITRVGGGTQATATGTGTQADAYPGGDNYGWLSGGFNKVTSVSTGTMSETINGVTASYNNYSLIITMNATADSTLEIGTLGGDSGSPVFAWNSTTGRYELIAVNQAGGGTGEGYGKTSYLRSAPLWTVAEINSFNDPMIADTSTGGVITMSVADATGLGTLTQGSTVWNFHGLANGVTSAAATDAQLNAAKNLTFSGTGNILRLSAASVDLGAGSMTFTGGGTYTLDDGGVNTRRLNTAGYIINTGTTLISKITGSAGDDWRKIGAGTLRIEGSGTNGADLSLGEGLVELNRTGGAAVANVLITSGRGTVRMIGDSQISGTVAFGRRGGVLDLYGHNFTRDVVYAMDSGATLTNTAANTSSTFTWTGSGSGLEQTFRGGFTDGGSLAAGLLNVLIAPTTASGSVLTLTGVSNNAGGFAFNGGETVLRGFNTPHAGADGEAEYETFPNDWTYAGLTTGTVTVASGAKFTLADHAALNANVAVSAGGTFVITENLFKATAESVEGGLAGTPSSTLYGHQSGTVTLNGATAAMVATISGNTDQAVVYARNITGTGSFTKNGAGTITLSGTNTFSGAKTVSAGTLIGATSAALGNTTTNGWTVAQGAALGINNAAAASVLPYFSTTSQGTLALVQTGATRPDDAPVLTGYASLFLGASGTVQVGASGATSSLTAWTSGSGWNLGDGGGRLVMNLKLTGSGALTVGSGSGSGSVLLANTGNNFTGGITVNAGVALVVNAASALSTGSLTLNNGSTLAYGGSGTLTVSNATTLQSGSAATFNFGTATESGGLKLTNAISLGGYEKKFSVVSGMQTELSGVISSSNTSGALTKLGDGTLLLSGNNTYTGKTTLTSGTLILSGTNASTAGTVIQSGSLQLTSTGSLAAGGALSFTGAGTVDLGAHAQTVASLGIAAGIGSVTIGNGALTVSGGSTSVGASTNGSLTTLDLRTLTGFSHNSTGGSFVIGGDTASQGGGGTVNLASTSGATNTLTTTTLRVGSSANSFAGGSNQSTVGTLNLGTNNVINAGSVIIGGRAGGTATGVIQFQALTAPTLTIRGATGGTSRADVTVGSLSGSDYSIATGLVDLVTGVTGGSTLDARIGTLTVGLHGYNNVNYDRAATGTFLMGAGTLDATTIIVGKKSTTGGRTGSSATGVFTVQGGTVIADTLTLGDRASNNGAAVSGTFNLNSGATLAARLVQAGTGAATRNFNWSDGTIRNYDAATDLAISLGLTLNNASGAHTFDIGSGRTGTVSGVIAESATGSGITKTGSGLLILSAANTYTGTTTVSAGTLQLGAGATTGGLGSGAVAVSSGATLAFNRSDALAVTGVVSGAGAVAQNGAGITTLSGANTYSGGTTVNAGTLALGNASGLGSTSGALTVNAGTLDLGAISAAVGAVTLNGGAIQNGTLTASGVATQSGTIAAVLAGTGTLTQSGSGTTVLSGNNTYSGTTTISAGTLQIGAGGTSGSLGSGAVTDDATLIFNRSDSAAVANVISGAGTITQSGAGTTILTGANTYAGTTTISSGTLQVGAGGTSGSLGAGAVVNNGTLAFNRSDSVTLANAISGTGTLAQNGSGTLILTGANTFTGGAVVNAGTLQLGNITTTATYAYTGSALALNGGTLSLYGSSGGTVTHTYTFANLAAPVDVNGGTLSFRSTNATTKTFNAALDFSGNSTIAYSSGNYTHNLNLNGALTGTGTLNFTWTGGAAGRNITIGATGNDYDGAVVLGAASGAVTLNLSHTLGQADWTVGDADWTVRLSGETHTMTNLNGSVGGSIVGNGVGSVLSVGSGNTTGAFAGVLGQTSGNTLAFVKTGTASFTLSGTNTYTAGTTVNGGTLIAGANAAFGTGTVAVNNTGTLDLGTRTLANAFSVASGGKITGAGTVSGAVSVASGGVLAPGAAIGTQTFSGGVTLASGAVLLWDIAGSAPSVSGTDFDRIVISAGTLSVNSGAILKIAASSIDYTGTFWDSSRAFTIVAKSGTGTITGAFGSVDTTAAGSFSAQGAWSVLTSGTGELQAVWTPGSPLESLEAVPEPSTYGVIGAGALAAAAMVRRRKKMKVA